MSGGLVLGIAASRLLKASSSRRFKELRAQGYSSRQRPSQWGNCRRLEAQMAIPGRCYRSRRTVVSTNGNEPKDRRISELVQLLAEEGKTLIRQEIALAKAELQERVDLVKAELEDRRRLLEEELARDADSAKDELAESGIQAASGLQCSQVQA